MRHRMLVALAIMLLAISVATAAPSADLWSYWRAHDSASSQTVDHGVWSAFLEQYRHVDDAGIARIDYGAVTEADRQRLQDYIDRLAETPIRQYRRAVQLAYWINLYNALTVDVILDHYPVDSIRDIDISSGWFSDGPWGADLVTIEDRAVTLNDIEHRILRPIWQDPRIHYAVNCASIGCPDLQPVAFTAENAERLLDRAAHGYINDPRGARVEGGNLIVSSIYEWFQADFGGSEQGVLKHLRQYAKPALKKKLEGRTGYADARYNWTLNDVR